MTGVRDAGAHRVDLWLAFVAGPRVWMDDDGDDSPGSIVAELAAPVEGAALLAGSSWPIIWTGASVAELSARAVVLVGGLATAGVLAFVVSVPSHRLASRWGTPWQVAALRAVTVFLGSASFAGLTSGWAMLGCWPFGVMVGCDLYRTGATLGVLLGARSMLRRVTLSPVHLGIVVGLVLTGLVTRTSPTRLVVLYLMVVVVVLVAAVTLSVLHGSRGRLEGRQQRREHLLMMREHRRRSHWLHDDVCSELRFLRMRVESDGRHFLPADEIVGELDELDHRLRLRQLDEVIGSGGVRLAEVIQPFLRRAQQRGVQIFESPTLEAGSLVVEAEVARQIKRILSVFVSNAMHAHTPSLWLRIEQRPEQGCIIVEVEDEAGGFDVTELPAGRGLDTLRAELGPDALTLERTGRGTRARALVHMSRYPRRSLP
ncbi:hypothetical protein [Rhabdothermincola sediminis]|uniref:hypothetical protein n=1 Tax=Rhabdothermincola sediminis TaxID=2751370 RepID=UPI001AA02494|nr:hypothetical protein [Rhabdothermincola sediminis]